MDPTAPDPQHKCGYSDLFNVAIRQNNLQVPVAAAAATPGPEEPAVGGQDGGVRGQPTVLAAQLQVTQRALLQPVMIRYNCGFVAAYI